MSGTKPKRGDCSATFFVGEVSAVAKDLTAAAKEAVAWTREQSGKDTEESLAKMAAAGATLHKIDASAIQARSQAAVAEMESEGAWSQGLWKAIQEIK